MRWRYRPEDEWHRVFAFLPVIASGQWVWLEHVERRLIQIAFAVPIYEYRFPEREA